MNGSSVNLSPLKWSYFFLQRLHTEHDIWLFVGSLGSMDWLIWSSCRYLFNFSISFFWFVWKETDPTSEYRLQVEKIGKYWFKLFIEWQRLYKITSYWWIDNYRWYHNIQNKLIALAESSRLRVGIANFVPLRSHLAPFLSSLTSGMEEIVMHERYHDMQLTY